MRRYLIDPNATDAEETTQQELSFAERTLLQGRAAKAARMSSSKYRSVDHVSSTTNILERLFSGCKLVMNEKRKHMDPDTLDMIMFLKVNRTLWENKSIIDEIIKEAGEDDDE